MSVGVKLEAERYLEKRQGILQHSRDVPTAIHPFALPVALCYPYWYQSLGVCVEGVAVFDCWSNCATKSSLLCRPDNRSEMVSE